MTREELFRAVGEVREDQIADADTGKKKTFPWRRYGAAAACLALLLAGGTALTRLHHTETDPGEPESAAAEQDAGVDGSWYSAPEDTEAKTAYSTGVEIGEAEWMAAMKPPQRGNASAACLAWMTPEEILAKDTAVFRGTVRELRYYEVTGGGSTAQYTVAAV